MIDSHTAVVWDPPLAALRERLAVQRAILRDAVDAAPAAIRDRKPAADRWSIAEVIEHLARTESGIAGLIRRSTSTAAVEDRTAGPLEPAAFTEPTPLDPGRVVNRSIRWQSPEGVRPRDGLGFDAAWAALEVADQKLHTALVSGNGRDLGAIVHPHPALGTIDLYQWIAFIGLHEVRHAEQVRETARAVESAVPPV